MVAGRAAPCVAPLRVRRTGARTATTLQSWAPGGGWHVLWGFDHATTRTLGAHPASRSTGRSERGTPVGGRRHADRGMRTPRNRGSIGMTIARGSRLEALPIIEAKLHPVTAARGSVDRSRIVDRLLDPDAPTLVTLAAPAGYGKTTVLAQWVEREARPVAWLTVDAVRQRPHGVRRVPRLRARPHRRRRRVAPRRHDDGPQPDPLVRGPPPARGHPPLAAAGRARHRRRAPADRRHVARRAGDVREPPAAGLPPRRRGPRRAAAAGRPSPGRAQGARDRRRDPRARRAGDRGPHRRGGLAAVDRRRVGARGPHRGLGGRHLPRDARPRTRRAGCGLDDGRVRRRRADRRLPAVRGRAPDRRRAT